MVISEEEVVVVVRATGEVVEVEEEAINDLDYSNLIKLTGCCFQ